MGAAITNTMEVAGLVAGTMRERADGSAPQLRKAEELSARADRLEAEAGRREADAQLAAMESALAGRRAVAATRSGYAASGVRVDSGSALDAAADASAWGEYERGKAERSAGLETWALRTDAAALRGEAEELRRTSSGGNRNGLRTLLGTGSALLGTGAGKILMNPSSVFA